MGARTNRDRGSRRLRHATARLQERHRRTLIGEFPEGIDRTTVAAWCPGAAMMWARLESTRIRRLRTESRWELRQTPRQIPSPELSSKTTAMRNPPGLMNRRRWAALSPRMKKWWER